MRCFYVAIALLLALAPAYAQSAHDPALEDKLRLFQTVKYSGWACFHQDDREQMAKLSEDESNKLGDRFYHDDRCLKLKDMPVHTMQLIVTRQAFRESGKVETVCIVKVKVAIKIDHLLVGQDTKSKDFRKSLVRMAGGASMHIAVPVTTKQLLLACNTVLM